jgi:hypothetical protein
MSETELIALAAIDGKIHRCHCHRRSKVDLPTPRCAICCGKGFFRACQSCSGSGFDKDTQQACNPCGGRGTVPLPDPRKAVKQRAEFRA